jgi:hypothetical protein
MDSFSPPDSFADGSKIHVTISASFDILLFDNKVHK